MGYYSEYCFYSPSSKNIIDFLDSDDRTQIEQETLEQVQKREPDAIKLKSDDAVLWYEQSWKTSVLEIDESRYLEQLEQLNVLLRVGYSLSDDCETFRMSEMLTGNITGICCRIVNRYFTFNDSVTLKHHEIHQRIIESEAYKSKH